MGAFSGRELNACSETVLECLGDATMLDIEVVSSTPAFFFSGIKSELRSISKTIISPQKLTKA